MWRNARRIDRDIKVFQELMQIIEPTGCPPNHVSLFYLQFLDALKILEAIDGHFSTAQPIEHRSQKYPWSYHLTKFIVKPQKRKSTIWNIIWEKRNDNKNVFNNFKSDFKKNVVKLWLKRCVKISLNIWSTKRNFRANRILRPTSRACKPNLPENDYLKHNVFFVNLLFCFFAIHNYC